MPCFYQIQWIPQEILFGYKYGNSFGIVYDHVKTFSGFGELSVDINRDFTLGINAEVMKYTLSEEEEAWNLPKIRGSFFMDYQINEQWYAGANLFYMGEREDMFSKTNYYRQMTQPMKLHSK